MFRGPDGERATLHAFLSTTGDRWKVLITGDGLVALQTLYGTGVGPDHFALAREQVERSGAQTRARAKGIRLLSAAGN